MIIIIILTKILLNITDVSGAISLHHNGYDVTVCLNQTQMFPETSIILNQLTRLIAQEYFINVFILCNFEYDL